MKWLFLLTAIGASGSVALSLKMNEPTMEICGWVLYCAGAVILFVVRL